MSDYTTGNNVRIGDNVKIGAGVKIEDNVVIYDNVQIGENTNIGPNVVLGHPLGSYYSDPEYKNLETTIGKNCIIRVNSVIYCGTNFADNVATGTSAVVRERCTVGEGTRIGTLVQFENDTVVGKNVLIETATHITAFMKIGDNVFIGPQVVCTNDNQMGRGKDIKLIGPTIEDDARIGGNAILLPGVKVGRNSVVGAGSVVTRDVEPNTMAYGVPAKPVGKVPEPE